MKFFKSKVFIICLIAAIVLALVPTLIAAFGGTDLLRAALGTVSKPFTMCASGIANAFNGFVEVFTQYDALKEENEELKEQLKEYEDKEYNEALLKEQNNWLKEYLNLHNEQPSFVLKDAQVISREAGNYSTVLTLNKGSVHGVKLKMPVLTGDGLVGRVSEVGLDWCKISTVVEASSSIRVYTDRGSVEGVVEGDAALRLEGLCKMDILYSDSNIQIGDRVYTAGGSEEDKKSSQYPSGLLIGSVSSIDVDDTTGKMVAEITPAVDFKNLNSITNVVIVCGFVTESTPTPETEAQGGNE